MFQVFKTKEAAEHYLAGYNNQVNHKDKGSAKGKRLVKKYPYKVVKVPDKYDIVVYLTSRKKYGVSQWASALNRVVNNNS